MMNNRFDAQLRQHLIGTADERPVDGQLASIIDKVAVTSQRRGLAARLAWDQGRIGPFPSAAVRFGLIAIGLSLAMVAGALIASSPKELAPTPAPSSTAPLGGAFTSTIHGISVDYPSGWLSRPATEPWTGDELTFDSPAADVLYHPALGADLYLAIASQPYGGLTEDEWRMSIDDWLCPTGGAFGSFTFAGVDAFVRGCGWTQGASLTPDDRGYVIKLYVSGENPSLALGARYDWDWFKAMLETVDLHPAEAAAGPEPTAMCVNYRSAGSYTADVDARLTVDVPATADQPWHGLPYTFDLRRAACLSPGPSITAGIVGYMYPDACNRSHETELDAESYASAIALLDAQTGHDPISMSVATIDGRRASVFTVTAPPAGGPGSCANGDLVLFDGARIAPGETIKGFLVDLGDRAVYVVIADYGSLSPDVAAELEDVVASMRIVP